MLRARAPSQDRPKHLDRYVHEFAGKHNVRDSGTLVADAGVARLVGRTLLYRT